jgi:hypothetical protein
VPGKVIEQSFLVEENRRIALIQRVASPNTENATVLDIVDSLGCKMGFLQESDPKVDAVS